VDPRLSLRFPRHRRLWPQVTAALDGDLDIAHDAEHVLRVYRWALRLAEAERLDADLAGAAALVHDLVNIPKESADRPLASSLSAACGAEVLPDAGYTPDEVDAIVEAVRTCSWSRGQPPTTPLGAILQDADRLDAIGAIGVLRGAACAQGMAGRSSGTRLYDPDDPLAQTDRPLDDRQNALDHYALKLLRLADSMNTPAARTEASRRHAFMCAFLEALGRELA
jgi:uncharacterized protein